MAIQDKPVVNFALRKEITFVAMGSVAGGIIMHLSILLLDLSGNASYITTLLVAARVVGSSLPEVGLLLHLAVSTIIGIVTGIFLHRVLKFDISGTGRGLVYGIVAGVVVFVVFAIPVYQLLLGPNLVQVLSEFDPGMTLGEISGQVQEGLPRTLALSLFHHIIWGLVLGLASSALTRRMGANYRCYECDIEFAKSKTYRGHRRLVHESPSPDMKRVLILGGGYAGVNVLKAIQERFEDDVNVSISLVSESNYSLHTPMLPELAVGTIEPRHIATPIRNFCRRARFYRARVTGIDLQERKVTVRGRSDRTIQYDYLVLAMGSETNFFGNENVKRHALTIKTLGDATRLRNHVIGALEDADQEQDHTAQEALATFVVVGGGFSGVETVGELNDFVRESARRFYRNIDPGLIRTILVASGGEILPEIGGLGGYAKESLEKAGVTVLLKTRLADASEGTATLDSGDVIRCGTLVWAGGVAVDDVISGLDTKHHKSGRVVVDGHLRLEGRPEVFALGDCALVVDPKTGTPYPPTAQHAIRQAKVASENLAKTITGDGGLAEFTYDTKGSMAKIGKKDGVALLMGLELRGFAAWMVWKQYYLSALPTFEKRMRVGIDWFVDLFFPKDITRL